MLGTFINALLSVDADRVCGPPYGVVVDDLVNHRSG